MANQIYCKHCGKLIDADSAFCMHCGGVINTNSKSTPQANKQDISFIRQLDILGGKFLIGIINIIRRFCGFMKQYHKIPIFVIGICAVALAILYCADQEIEERAILIIPAILLLILTLYFSFCKSIKILLPLGILLISSYSVFIYFEHKDIYGSSTTFFDTVRREFYWITPNYTIPDHATSIEDGAFLYCELLLSVTIPNSVSAIGDYAFSSCLSLTRVYCKATTPPRIYPSHITGSIFGFSNFYGTIYVPRNSVKAYKAAKGWKEYANDIVGYDF